MTAGFKTELVQPILEGTKIHTFRGGQRWRLGLDVQFVIHNRTPQRAEFKDRLPVASLQAAELREEGFFLDGRQLEPMEVLLFARQDGFASTEEFLAFFAKRERPLAGQLIHWTKFRYLQPDEAAEAGVVADYLCRLVRAALGSTPTMPWSCERELLTLLGESEATAARPCTVDSVLADLRLLEPHAFLADCGFKALPGHMDPSRRQTPSSAALHQRQVTWELSLDTYAGQLAELAKHLYPFAPGRRG